MRQKQKTVINWNWYFYGNVSLYKLLKQTKKTLLFYNINDSWSITSENFQRADCVGKFTCRFQDFKQYLRGHFQ